MPGRRRRHLPPHDVHAPLPHRARASRRTSRRARVQSGARRRSPRPERRREPASPSPSAGRRSACTRGSPPRTSTSRPLSSPWRADLTSLPAVSYRVSPSVLLAGSARARRRFRRRRGSRSRSSRARAGTAPEPEPQPGPCRFRAHPLEQALVLLEDASRTNGAEDRRRALEHVAEVLDDWGDAGPRARGEGARVVRGRAAGRADERARNARETSDRRLRARNGDGRVE